MAKKTPKGSATNEGQGEVVSHSDDPMLSFSEAGALIGKTHSTISRWVSEGLLAAFRDPSGLRRIRKSELEQFYGATAMAKAAEEKAERQRRMAEERRQWQQEIDQQTKAGVRVYDGKEIPLNKTTVEDEPEPQPAESGPDPRRRIEQPTQETELQET